jgi:hypothetical protein
MNLDCDLRDSIVAPLFTLITKCLEWAVVTYVMYTWDLSGFIAHVKCVGLNKECLFAVQKYCKYLCVIGKKCEGRKNITRSLQNVAGANSAM